MRGPGAKEPRESMRAIAILLWTCALTGLGAGLAHAKGEYSRSGGHASMQIVVAVPMWSDQLQNQVTSTGSASAASVSTSAGLDMRVGYRFHERVAAEMGFDWVADYGMSLGGADVQGASNWMYYVNAKVYMMTETIQPFAILGMGAYHLDYTVPGSTVRVDGTSFSPRFGAGVDYYFTWKWGMTAEFDYVLGTRQLVDLDRISFSVGAFYRF